MKKFTPNGAAIKRFREQLERLSTQKEFAHEIGVSERTLRQMENENLPIVMNIVDKMVKVLNVNRDKLVYAIDFPREVPTKIDFASWFYAEMNTERLVPRLDNEYASATMDEVRLFEHAGTSHDVVATIETTLTEETAAYAEELIDILTSLSWSKRRIRIHDRVPVSAPDETEVRRRIRQLLVLLKGNDVWIYETKHYRTLPERNTLPPADEPSRSEGRTVLALGPPGEYGETTMSVPIDYGQPFISPAWNLEQGKTG
jgi:DNA-binding XRE family transcriptional regulator